MTTVFLVLLDDCLKAVYRGFGLRQEDPASWNPPRTPHLGDLATEIERRVAEDPANQRARALRTSRGTCPPVLRKARRLSGPKPRPS
jgi:hypothetical protein